MYRDGYCDRSEANFFNEISSKTLSLAREKKTKKKKTRTKKFKVDWVL